MSSQYNKFVESGSKNYALVSRTTANTELNDNQTQIRDLDINGLIVRRSHFYKLITIGYKCNLDCYNVFSDEISDPLLIEGLPHYIAPLGPS